MGDEDPIVKAHEKETSKMSETWGNIEIHVFSSFTLYFFPLCRAHLVFFITPWVFAKHKVRTLTFGDFLNNFIHSF
jgi:hypothetical protein